jgi:hypothetical protein
MSYGIDTFFTSALLKSESNEEYQKFHAAFERECAPRNIIEAMYVAEIAFVSWRMLRLQRAEAGIISAAFEPALQNLLMPVSGYVDIEGQLLARGWFSEAKAKTKVRQLLAERGLHEAAIEAEAIRLSLGSLEIIEKMLAAAVSRRSRLFRSIEDYRASFAKEVRAVSDRAIESGGEVFNLEDFSDKKSA